MEEQTTVLSKVLDRCTNQAIVPLADLYDDEVILKSKKVSQFCYSNISFSLFVVKELLSKDLLQNVIIYSDFICDSRSIYYYS